jgi:signal transduction histidine kinase/ActR/RegA family two-component response regulator
MKGVQLIGKVLIGFLLTGAAMSVAILFMYRSIHDVSVAVDEAAKPNARLEEWKTCVNLLYEAENVSRNVRITQDTAGFKLFDSIREANLNHLSILFHLNKDSAKDLVFCDSLRILSEERFDQLGDWIGFSDAGSDENSVLDDILKEMANREKAVSEKNAQISESTSDEDHNTKVVVNDKHKSFWQRLRNKKKNLYEPVAVSQGDSTNKFDSLVPVVGTKEIRKTIETGQIRIESKADSLIREESRLLKADQLIMSRIHAISDQYEKLCGKETAEKLKTVSMAASAGTRSVTRWVIVAALCIILFSIFFIGRDIMRNRKFQAQLQVAKENAERLARTKEEFMANMSHEIRTPLNVVSGLSSKLLKTGFDEKHRSYLEGIHRSSEFLIALVNDILDISKVKSGKLQLEKISFRLKEICEDLENAFGTKAKEKGLAFTTEISKDLPELIMGDPVRFRQILFNLVSNALKFTDKGFIKISFDEKLNANGEKNICIRVADSGIGIAKDKINVIFEEFEQADSSITRKYGGTGLGLSITRILVSEMKGTILTESELGKGTLFTITLPLEAGKITKPAAKNKPGDISLKDKTILVCDDEPMNRMLAAHLIKTYEGKVLEASGGKEAIEIFSKEKIDLVLLDLEMPDMSGEETIAEIRKLKEKNNSTVPIIAVTGKDKLAVFTNEALAVDGYIQKPYKEETMLAEIKRVLETPTNKLPLS